MMIPDQTVTLYNAAISGAVETFFRIVITGAYWESSIGANRRRGGDIANDKAFIILPLDSEGYVAPKAWEALEDKSTAWTLRAGDYICFGSIEQEIAGAYTISDLRKEYDDVLRITSVDPIRGIARVGHFEISAK